MPGGVGTVAADAWGGGNDLVHGIFITSNGY